MSWLRRLVLGSGRLRPRLRAALEAEGLVLVEEGLDGSVRYHRFKAPGRRHHGKVTPQRIAIGISERRIVAYCRSGFVKLIDTEFANERLAWVDVGVEDGQVAFRVDYDRADLPKVAGQITISARTPRARRIADEVRARIARAASA